jgi:hypothetical protein
VTEEHDLGFISSRAENIVGICLPAHEEVSVRVKAGLRPNGLAYDAGGRLLLTVNTGDPARGLGQSVFRWSTGPLEG